MSLLPAPGLHVAELNLARLSAPIDDPRVADFVNNLDRVNAVAERSPGFQWRLKGEAEQMQLAMFPLPDGVIPNLSVWESVEALRAFAFDTVHKQFFQRRGEWMLPINGPHFVMWPVAPGTRSGLGDALERLAKLGREGDTPEAFGWKALKSRA